MLFKRFDCQYYHSCSQSSVTVVSVTLMSLLAFVVYMWYKIYMGTKHPYTLKKKDELIVLYVTMQEIELYIHSFYQGLSNHQRLQGIAELKIREWKIPLSIPLNASLLLALWLFNNLMSLSTSVLFYVMNNSNR